MQKICRASRACTDYPADYLGVAPVFNAVMLSLCLDATALLATDPVVTCRYEQ